MIRMNNERFEIPELLFYPSDVGIQEMGLSESIMHCMTLVDKELVPHLLNNIVLTGGNALLPGFQDRIPLTYAWQSGCDLALDPIFPSMCVSRHDYEEHGHVACINKFNVS
uniref:Uncharacterized protein n=1 Tax=Biomphalaria glabrata TaxID=6526 RepID=A0A2C9LTA8_BIOGL